MALFTDDFADGSVDPAWTFTDPIGDCTLSENAGVLSIDVPGGVTHEFWSSARDMPRLLQAAPNGAFTVETQILTDPLPDNYSSATLVMRVDTDDWVRWGLNVSGGIEDDARRIYGGGTPEYFSSASIAPDGGGYYRIEYDGTDTLTFYRSLDGTNWTNVGTGVLPAGKTPQEVGFAVHNSGSPTPAITGQFEYFTVDTPAPVADFDATVNGRAQVSCYAWV